MHKVHVLAPLNLISFLIHSLFCYFLLATVVTFFKFLYSCSSQGKEIIDFYLKELEDEGITDVPRWTPSSPLPAPRPRLTSLFSSPAVLPKLTVTPAVSIPLPADAKDVTCQDAVRDSVALQDDGFTEMLPGTPEGPFPQMTENKERRSFFVYLMSTEYLH